MWHSLKMAARNINACLVVEKSIEICTDSDNVDCSIEVELTMRKLHVLNNSYNNKGGRKCFI